MRKIVKVSLIFLLSFMFLSVFKYETNAQLSCLPSSCQQPGLFEVDFACVNKKLLDPGASCCEEKCLDTNDSFVVPSEYDPLFSFFGYTFAITSGQQLPTLINLAITTFLGFVSVYAIIMGIYQGAILRAGTDDPEEIAKISKTFITLILGFFLAWGFIVIIQIVASLLGLGSLQNLTLIGDTGGTTITIQ